MDRLRVSGIDDPFLCSLEPVKTCSQLVANKSLKAASLAFNLGGPVASHEDTHDGIHLHTVCERDRHFNPCRISLEVILSPIPKRTHRVSNLEYYDICK